MHIVQLEIGRFRGIKHALIRPQKHNVLLAPNNSGKTAVLEALNLLLNPDLSAWSKVIDENDFYNREYLPLEGVERLIVIEAVLTGLNEDDEDEFRNAFVAWDSATGTVVEETEEGTDPFAGNEIAVRVAFEGFYDAEDDDFKWASFFRRRVGETRVDAPKFGRSHKRRIGFLIYRDIRALTRPTTLEATTLFARLLQSQDVPIKNFEAVLDQLDNCMAPIVQETEFISILNSYKAELEKFLLLYQSGSSLSFEFTARTRDELKVASQLYSKGVSGVALPIQKMGAGTRSLALLAILTLIMRRRQRGILALEEPETFLFPHAQRRVLHEALLLADQTFVTTHSPYVLEQMPIEAVGKLERQEDGEVGFAQLSAVTAKAMKLYNRRLRQTFSEAMLGKAVVIVEGESDKWWLDAAASLMHGVTDGVFIHESFDLTGITVISADTHGDAIKTSDFFRKLNLDSVIVLDKIDDAGVVSSHCASGTPTIFLKQSGIEAAIVNGLDVAQIESFLMSAPLTSGKNLSAADVEAKTEPDLRKEMMQLLKNNKGSRQTHDWLIEKLPAAQFPKPLLECIRIINRHYFGEIRIGGTVTLLA